SSAPRDVLSARATSPSSEPSSRPKAAGTQPPPIPAGPRSRSMPATLPPPIPAGSPSRSIPATQPPPIPTGAPSRSMRAASPDTPVDERPLPFIAQPIAPAPLTLDEPNARVPLLIAVDTPSSPIASYAKPAPLSMPPVTIQPRNRQKA